MAKTPKNIAVFISSHGFGHMSRTRNLIFEILRKAHHLNLHTVYVFSNHSAQWFHPMMKSYRLKYIHYKCDVGVHQVNSLEMDLVVTKKNLKTFFSKRKSHIQELKATLTQYHISLVLTDTAHLPLAVAKELNIPGLCLGNFTWVDVYTHLNNTQDTQFKCLIDEVSADYAKANLLLCLPWHTQMRPFKLKHIKPVSLITPRKNKGTMADWEVVTGLKKNKRVKDVLLSFGGHDFKNYEASALAEMSGKYRFIVSGSQHNVNIPNINIPNLRVLPQLANDYQLVIKYCDAVITKPGYGILTDCLIEKKPIVFTNRGPFVEYGILKKWLQTEYTSTYMPQKSLSNGNFEPFLDDLFQKDMKIPVISTQGALEIVEVLKEFL